MLNINVKQINTNNKIISLINILKVLIIVYLFVFIIYKNCMYSIINFDDYRFIRSAREMCKEKGLICTLWESFFNMDLGNEYRTYGLLRVFTVIWAIIFGANNIAYGFLLGVLHCVSTIFVYFVSNKVFNGRLEGKRSILISGIWLMNPFSTTQTMHHMLYILMPAYVFIILIFIDLTLKKNIKYILEFFCMFGIVFFGENMIITLYFFIVYRIIECKSRERTFWRGGYLLNGIIITILLGGHYLHYKFFRYSPMNPERFSVTGINDLSFLEALNNCVYAIGADLKDIITVWNKFNVGYVKDKIGLLTVVFYVFICLFIYLGLSYKCLKAQKISKREAATGAIICFSTYFIYLFLQIMDGHYFNSRYMMTCVPFMIIAIILVFATKEGRIWRGLEISLFCVIGVSWMIHYTVMLDYMHNVNECVIEAIQKGEDADKKFVIFANAYPGNNDLEYTMLRQPGIFTDSEQFSSVINGSTIASPFQIMWTIQGWMNEYSDMYPVYGYTRQRDGTYELIGQEIYENIEAKDIMAICTEDIYFYNDDRSIRLKTYYDMNIFEKNSLAYRGIKIIGDESYYNKLKRYSNIDECIYNSNLISINCGSDVTTGILREDKVFSEQSDDTVSYGYIQGSASQYGFAGSRGFDSNRNGEFAYKIKLKKRENVIICLEFQDLWSVSKNARVFDLNIRTDSQNILIDDIDLYLIGKNGTVRLLIPLEETDTIEVEAVFERGDIPFCNIIRVLRDD